MRVYKFLFASCVLFFVSLCLLHYFSLRSLWLDENFLFLNIKSSGFLEIFGMLKYSQAFPRIYLIIVKLFSEAFNYEVLSLRFFPLVCMLSAFFVWRKVYENRLSDKWAVLLALFSFSASYCMSYYAAEFKHYSMDVLAMGIFCLYLAYQKQAVEKEPSKQFILATLLLPLTLLFSYSSFFIFWMVSYNFLLSAKKRSKFVVLMAIYTFICLIFVFFIYCVDIKYTLNTYALFSYWDGNFLCVNSFYCFLKTFWEGLRKLSVWWFGNGRFFIKSASFLIPIFVVSLFGYGIKSLRRNKLMLWEPDSLALVIFLELFGLGIIKKYPFTGARITLFFAPFVFFLIAKGISFLKINKPLYIGLSVLYISFLALCGLNSVFAYLNLYN